MSGKLIPRYYKCSLDGKHWWSTYEASAGQAKQDYIRMLDGCADDCYLSILCRVDSPKTTQAFRDNAKYRNIPFAYVGMNVKIGGDKGIIVGHNSSVPFLLAHDDFSCVGICLGVLFLHSYVASSPGA